MLGILLESQAVHQRRTGGVILSVAAHLTIIGSVTAFTLVRPHPRPQPEKPAVVHVVYPKDPPPSRPTTVTRRSGPTSGPIIDVRNLWIVDPPKIPPIGLPPIAPSSGFTPDSVLIGGGPRGAGGLGGDLLADPGSGDGSTELRGADLMMRIVKSATPEYPEQLRRAGVNGRVLVQFVVDTAGRVDQATITIVQSTHDLFSDAARRALVGFRFRPSEAGGRRVRAAAQMPFEFLLKQ